MKGSEGECFCLGDDCLAVQPNKLSLVVVSEGPSSPLRAVDQVGCPRGTGWALELAGRSKLGSSPAKRNRPGILAEHMKV